MDSNEITQRIAQRVGGAIEESGLPLLQIAEQAAIPRTTLKRRLSGSTPFPVDEIARLADVLNVSFDALISFNDASAPTRPAVA